MDDNADLLELIAAEAYAADLMVWLNDREPRARRRRLQLVKQAATLAARHTMRTSGDMATDFLKCAACPDDWPCDIHLRATAVGRKLRRSSNQPA